VRAALLAAAALALAGFAAARVLRPRIATPAAWDTAICSADAGGSLLACGKPLYSQYDEELIIRDFLRDRRGGTFLDVGSADYKSGSTTYYLEHELGWSGVAIDARAEYGANYAKYRPKTQFLSYLVTDHSGTMDPFYRLKTKFLMSTESKEWADKNGPGDYETVLEPTITLNDLLAKTGVTKVDFMSMDIETGEPAALAGFDIERYRPDLVCVEVTEGVRDRVAAYFDAHSYERIARYEPYDAVNWYLQPKAPPGR
jgi:hypothetical protein